jgi:3-methylcrotonyl-CoA carboxylase alpha subunit
MFKKILIANRGEIALRVIKTCQKMDIKTVTLFAQDDADLPHASAGDESFNLGRGALIETYLNQDKIIEIALKTKADAIHPGYGFLSENTDFCKNVSAAGLTFIGPSVEAIELMGDKKASKLKMQEIGVPLVPGYHGDEQNPDFLLQEAIKIGFPVLIKATAGGGGKGMRIVESKEEFISSLEGAKREAMNAFSNDQVLLEKYLVNPRHIEVQLVSDGQGNHFHFFERECSIQRRYQKVIEESPVENLEHSLRSKMYGMALRIAETINYCGAGTIEYILSEQGEFYFLEMNTRLQVEHPVTEMVTGFDLVELQIKAAQAQAFEFKQVDIKQHGHAIECRIYAEDPDQGFLPTTGRIQAILGNATIDYRLDSGYANKNMISINYDPMLAKLIVHDLNRYMAIDKMQLSLNEVLFSGVKTNRGFLKRVLDHDKFLDGKIDTHFIDKEELSLKLKYSRDEIIRFMAVSFFCQNNFSSNIWGSKFQVINKEILINNESYSFKVTHFNGYRLEINYLGEKHSALLHRIACQDMHISIDGDDVLASHYLFSKNGTYQVFINGVDALIKPVARAKRVSHDKQLLAGSLQSPMPGKIFKITSKVGDKVKVGDPVIVMEAMKMEHTIKASKDGVVKEIFYKEGDQIQGGILLCEIE